MREFFYDETSNENLKNFKVYKGTIENTDEKCEMVCIGFWWWNHRKVSTYIRKDKPDRRQYSKDRHNRFWIETED